MKEIVIRISFKFADLPVEEKSRKFILPVLSSIGTLKGIVMTIAGIIYSMLYSFFEGISDNEDTCKTAYICAKIVVGRNIYTIYERACEVPCAGQIHLMWLHNVWRAMQNPLLEVLCDDALKMASTKQYNDQN